MFNESPLLDQIKFYSDFVQNFLFFFSKFSKFNLHTSTYLSETSLKNKTSLETL